MYGNEIKHKNIYDKSKMFRCHHARKRKCFHASTLSLCWCWLVGKRRLVAVALHWQGVVKESSCKEDKAVLVVACKEARAMVIVYKEKDNGQR